MNREIKFKAKTLNDGMWIEGDLKHLARGGVAIEGKHCIMEVDPSTVCQYTGLKDKDGNEIWEHDLLQSTPYSKPREVKFINGAFMFWCDYLDSYSTTEGMCELLTKVGNKYDKEEGK